MQVQLYMSREDLKRYNDGSIVCGSFVRGLGAVIRVYVDSAQIDYAHIPGMPTDTVKVHPIKKEESPIVNDPSSIDGEYVHVKLTSDIASKESPIKSFFNKGELERSVFDPKELNGQIVKLHVYEENNIQIISAQKDNTSYIIATVDLSQMKG